MKVIYRAENRKSLSEMDCEAQDAVRLRIRTRRRQDGLLNPV